MKTFSSMVLVRQPVDALWAVVRDRLPEIVEDVDDVESVVVLERDESDAGCVRLVNEWVATQRIPDVLVPALGTARIAWIDRAAWDAASHVARWSIDPLTLPDAVECTGATTYEPAMGGRGTRVTVRGSFDLDPAALGGTARALRGPVTALVESIASSLVPRSTHSLVHAADRLLAAGG